MGIRQKMVLPEIQEQADQRLRTFKALFRGLGLLYDENSTLRNTEVGNQVQAVLSDQLQAVDDYGRRLALAERRRLAQLLAPVLARYELASPLSRSEYPPDTDIRPLLAIWRTMRALGDKLHWEELGRVLTGCLRDSDVDGAIDKIRDARLTPGYDPRDEAMMDRLYGPRQPPDQGSMADRLDVWFSRAAFKDVFLEARDRSDRFRYLNNDFVDLIDKVIADPPPNFDGGDAAEYVRWMGSVDRLPLPLESADESIDPIVAKCRRWGDRQIIAFAGPAGTGKTRMAEKVADVLVEGDNSRLETIQFHAAFTYEEFVGGLAPENGTFTPQKGVLLQISERARLDPEQRTHVLLIDELSRADVANVLGELLTYVEYRGRPFRVPAFDETFALAPNLVILATLNLADRSVINIDDATIRRLRVVNVPPSGAALRSILESAGMRDDLARQLRTWFDSLPDDVPFGHGLFVGARDERDLHELWHESLHLYLRRGGVATYPEPELIEAGYVWRDTAFADGGDPSGSNADTSGSGPDGQTPAVDPEASLENELSNGSSATA